MLLRLSPMEAGRPGQAILRVIGWTGAVTQLELTILSNQGNVYLQPPQAGASQWNSNPFWFRLDTLIPDGDAFYIPVGSAVVDPLLSTTNARYQVSVREVGSEASEQAILKVESGIRLSEAGGETESQHAFGPLPSDPVIPEPTPAIAIEPLATVEEPPPAEATIPELPASTYTEPEAPKAKNRKLIPIIVAGLALVLLLAAAAYWWLNRKPAPTAVVPPATTVVAGGCDAAAMSTQKELEFVQACMGGNPDTDTVLTTIAAAIETGHCGVAQRLYANRGRAGDTRVAMAYAQEYDPQDHQANECFKEPNDATAAYWYDTVLATEPENVKAKRRFEELSK